MAVASRSASACKAVQSRGELLYFRLQLFVVALGIDRSSLPQVGYDAFRSHQPGSCSDTCCGDDLQGQIVLRAEGISLSTVSCSFCGQGVIAAFGPLDQKGASAAESGGTEAADSREEGLQHRHRVILHHGPAGHKALTRRPWPRLVEADPGSPRAPPCGVCDAAEGPAASRPRPYRPGPSRHRPGPSRPSAGPRRPAPALPVSLWHSRTPGAPPRRSGPPRKSAAKKQVKEDVDPVGGVTHDAHCL